MAPSVRGTASRVSKRQAGLRDYAKISKVTATHPQVKSKLEEAAVASIVNPKKTTKSTPKRKRSDVEDDSEADPGSAYICANGLKKPKLQLPSPPCSQHKEDEEVNDIESSPPIQFRQLSLDTRSVPEPAPPRELPPALQDFVSLHAAFLRAFAIHIVHNGQSTPADLSGLLTAVTRLWKKHAVMKEDIQRMLAIYELDAFHKAPALMLKHKEGPFKLTLIGGDIIRHNVEYVNGSSTWDEYNLQKMYEMEIEAAFISQRSNPHSWLHGEIRHFPRLEVAVGVQTQARKEKAAAARREILGLSSRAQNRPGAQFAIQTNKDCANEEMISSQIVKDRTLSLLDRVRAKALANAAATPPTPEAIIRRYALGRINEVVEILRMKQQRKLSSNFMSSVHASPGKVRGKVSFGLNQLVSDIKGSLAVPIGDAEVRMCISILADEIPGMWVSVYAVGKVQSVILNGPGLSGAEVKKMLEEDEKMR